MIGFNDVEISQLIGLTTVRQHLEEGGYLAMRYLFELLGDPAFDSDEHARTSARVTPFEVIERQTTRPLAN